jgi:hypothetical protein
MMLDGELWELPMPVALMAEIVSGSSRTTSAWPTPTCADAYTDKLKSSQQKEGSMHSVNLSQAVSMKWTTPTVSGDYNAKGASATSGDGLATQVRAEAATEAGSWPRPTPCADGRGGVQSPGSHLSLEKAVEGWRKDGTNDRLANPWPTPVRSDHHARRKTVNWAGSDLVSTVTEVEELAGNTQPKSGGQLNPDWVELLMGWPVGWTSEEPMEALRWPWVEAGAFVALRGQAQHAWEPPRTSEKIKNRNKRVKAIGNGQDVSAFTLALKVLVRMKVPLLKRAA